MHLLYYLHISILKKKRNEKASRYIKIMKLILMEIFDNLSFEEIVATLLVIALIVYFTYLRIKYLFRGVKNKKGRKS